MLIPMYIYMYLEPLYEINLTFLTFFVGNKIINQVFFERSNFFLEINHVNCHCFLNVF